MVIRVGNASPSSIIHTFLYATKFIFQALDWVQEKAKMGNVWYLKGSLMASEENTDTCGRQVWWDQGAQSIRSSYSLGSTDQHLTSEGPVRPLSAETWN